MSGATTPVLAARLTAQDDTRQAFDSIRNGMRAVQAQASSANRAMRGTGVAASLRSIGAAVGLVHRQYEGLGAVVGRVYGRMSSLVPALGGLAAITSITGVLGLVNKVAEGRAQLIATAQSLGMTTKQLGAIGYLAKQGGVETDVMTGAVARLQRNLALAASGKNKDAARFFQHFGITMRDAHGRIADVTEVLPKLADALAKQSPALRNAWAQLLMGRGGVRALPLFTQGGDEMRKLLGQAISEDPGDTGDEDLRRYHQAELRLKSAVNSLKNTVAVQVAPILEPILSQMAEYIRGHRKDFGDAVTEVIKDVTDTVMSVDWRGIASDMGTIAAAIRDAVSALGGLRRVIEIIVAIKALEWFTGLTRGAIGAVGAIGKLAGAWNGVDAAATAAGTSGVAAVAMISGAIAAALGGLGVLAETARASALERSIPQQPGESDEDHQKRIAEAIAGGVVTPDVKGPADGGLGERAYRWLFGPKELSNLPELPRIVIPNGADVQGPNRLAPIAFPPLLPPAEPLPYPSPYSDPNTGLPFQQPQLRSIDPNQELGRVRVDVNINGLPPGSTTVNTDTSGAAQPGNISVGVNDPLGQAAGW